MPSTRTNLSHLRQARISGPRLPILTCYDYTTARLMHQAGLPAILVGDSAANVILGHPTTLPVSLEFMIEITAAVRRGAPDCLLIADMPFGTYQASVEQGVKNVIRMIQATNCDAVKLELAEIHMPLVQSLAGAGIAVIGHIGLRPQSIGAMGAYKAQGTTARAAERIVALSLLLEQSGAAAVLLEAVPPEVTTAVTKRTQLPVIGCGAGTDCHACVVVTHDALGWTESKPKFVPHLADLADPMKLAFARYMEIVRDGSYPTAEQTYPMPAAEVAEFRRMVGG